MAVLTRPVVFKRSASAPLAVLKLPVLFKTSASNPMAVLKVPVVLLMSAFVPRLVLVCAGATATRESEKMSATISTEKDLAVEWRNI